MSHKHHWLESSHQTGCTFFGLYTGKVFFVLSDRLTSPREKLPAGLIILRAYFGTRLGHKTVGRVAGRNAFQDIFRLRY